MIRYAHKNCLIQKILRNKIKIKRYLSSNHSYSMFIVIQKQKNKQTTKYHGGNITTSLLVGTT